jgi:hypothetical protein
MSAPPRRPTAGPPAVPALPSGARQQLDRLNAETGEEYGQPIQSMAASAASPSVSAEERADEIVRWLPAGIGNRYRAAICDAIRAAEAARDARWREAVGQFWRCRCEWSLSSKPLSTDPGCILCAPLRALLGEHE